MRRVVAKLLPEFVKDFARYCAVQSPPARRVRFGRRVPLRLASHVRMHLLPGDSISECIYASGVWEREVSRQVLDLAAGGGVFAQVGANLGYFCLLWAAARPDNQAYAFEPVARNVDLLRRNVADNGFAGRVHVLPVAAGRATGIASFDDGPPEQSGWGGLAAGAAPYGARSSVVVVRLDDLFPAGRLDVLMVDTEGADTWVLAGCETLLRERRIGVIYYEQNRPRMRALGIEDGAAERFLAGVGYESVSVAGAGTDVAEWRATPAGGPPSGPERGPA